MLPLLKYTYDREENYSRSSVAVGEQSTFSCDCNFVAQIFNKTGSFDLAKFFGLNSQEKKGLSKWLPLFRAASAMADSEIPGGQNDFASIPDEVTFTEVDLE
jgi:hypothetical protein